MKNYKYDIIGANIDYGVKIHPQADMAKLGFKIIKAEPVPIADCWWFRVSNSIDFIPGYLTELPDTFLFSDELQRGYHD